MSTQFCVTLVLDLKLSCCLGEQVLFSLNDSGREKLSVDTCTCPCNSSSGGVGGTITGACLVDNNRYKYTFSYDSGVLASSDSPLVSADISCVSCVQ